MRLSLPFFLVPIILWINPAIAGAPYCALRDPSHQIYSMFPSATSYRSAVGEFSTDLRQQVDERLPFRILGHELGQHTIYVPLEGSHPLGIVHVRSEMSDWGLIEIAWALTPDMGIRGFNYQRCRGKACKSVLKNGLGDLLTGKDAQALTQLYDTQAQTLRPELLTLTSDEQALATTTLRSAIKTIAITHEAWGDTVAEVQAARGEP